VAGGADVVDRGEVDGLAVNEVRRMRRAAPDEMLTMLPLTFSAIISLAKPRETRNGARRLTSKMRSHSAASMSTRKPLG